MSLKQVDIRGWCDECDALRRITEYDPEAVVYEGQYEDVYEVFNYDCGHQKALLLARERAPF